MDIKKILKIFIFGLILLFGVNNSCFALGSSISYDTNNYGTINFNGSVYKTNDRHEGLTGARFKVHDVNNTFSYYSQEEGNGVYGLGYFIADKLPVSVVTPPVNYVSPENIDGSNSIYNMIYSMMPRQLQEDFDEYLRTGSLSHLDKDFYYIENNAVSFPIPMFLEEVTAPEGYLVGEKIVLPAYVEIRQDDGNIFATISFFNTYRYLKYNKNVDYNNPISYFLSSDIKNDEVDCREYNISLDSIFNKKQSYVPIILFNKKGNVLLRITNYVNNYENYTTSRGKTLNYRVEVENYGTVVSHDNVIVTDIPKELEYVTGSASNGGIYNKTRHTITWNVSTINAGSKINLTYSVIVPKNVSLGAKFIGKSSITSKEVGEIHSRETTVSLLSNPETMAPIAVLILLCSLIGIIAAIKNHYNEKQKELES